MHWISILAATIFILSLWKLWSTWKILKYLTFKPQSSQNGRFQEGMGGQELSFQKERVETYGLPAFLVSHN